MRSGPVLAALGALALGGGLLTSSPASAAGPALSLPESDVSALQQLTESQPARYAGLVVDHDQGTVRVFVPATQRSAAGSAIQQLTKTYAGKTGTRLHIDVRPAKYSSADLDATMARIDTAEPFASATRAARTAWYVDPATNRVTVGLTTVTPEATRLARAAFGDRVELVQQDRHNAAHKEFSVPASTVHVVRTKAALTPPAGYGRLYDGTPYYSGDRIIYTQTVGNTTHITECTTAFVVSSGGAQQVASAGHCGPTGRVWYQGYFDETSSTIYESGTMGTAGHVEFGNNRMDAQVLTGGNYWPSVYGGSNNSDLAYGVAGAGSISVGMEVCADGTTTGESCGAKISAINACISLNDEGTTYTVCNQGLADATNSAPLSQPGDSGGPVWNLSSNPNNVTARGIISGGSSNGLHMNFTQITSFDSTFSATVLPGAPLGSDLTAAKR
jgi:hypothetical protein